MIRGLSSVREEKTESGFPSYLLRVSHASFGLTDECGLLPVTVPCSESEGDDVVSLPFRTLSISEGKARAAWGEGCGG